MKKIFLSSLVGACMVFILAVQFAPAFANAASLCGDENYSCFIVKCKYGLTTMPDGTKECGFLDVIAEVNLLTNTAFKLSVPITIIAIAWAGIKILLARGNPGKITEAKDLITKVLIGFIFILTAWLIVYTITNALLKPSVPTFLSK